jgi:hypothetical protein
MAVARNQMRHTTILIALLLLSGSCRSQDHVRAVTINKNSYKVYNDYTSLIITTVKSDTVINVHADYFTIDYRDINGDGYVDILGGRGGNTSECFDLFLFVAKSRTFRKVRNFDQFPAPTRLKGTRYFYSYHKSGCADMNWDSDLFYISNFKAIRIGNIAGHQCQKDEVQGLFIYKVVRGIEKFVKRLQPEVTSKYNEGKWGFIKEYWTKSWRDFVR